MEKKNLVIKAFNNDEEIAQCGTVTSVSRMWVEVKKVFANNPKVNIKVFDGDTVFKDLVIRVTSTGKNWMVDRNSAKNEDAGKAEKKAQKEKEKAEKKAKKDAERSEKKAQKEKEKAEKKAKKTEKKKPSKGIITDETVVPADPNLEFEIDKIINEVDEAI